LRVLRGPAIRNFATKFHGVKNRVLIFAGGDYLAVFDGLQLKKAPATQEEARRIALAFAVEAIAKQRKGWFIASDKYERMDGPTSAKGDNNMASLHKQATSANWFVAYSIYDKTTGKSKRTLRSTGTTDKKQAERIRAKLEAATLAVRKVRRSKAQLTPKAEREMIERGVREIMSGLS
jgi:hypothetical protein